MREILTIEQPRSPASWSAARKRTGKLPCLEPEPRSRPYWILTAHVVWSATTNCWPGLRSVRRGAGGAFILDHGGGWVALGPHKQGRHVPLVLPRYGGSYPGFVPDGIWSGDRCDGRFLLAGGTCRIQLSCGGGSCSRSMPPTWRQSSISTRRRRQRR